MHDSRAFRERLDEDLGDRARSPYDSPWWLLPGSARNRGGVCERFLGSLRRECLDHVLVLDDRHFQRVVGEYVRYHNAARPHQGLRQQTPVPAERAHQGNIVALPVLGGLHHDYRRAA